MKIIKGGINGLENTNKHNYKEAFLNILKQFQKKNQPVTENFHVAVIAWNIGNIKIQGIPGFEHLMESTKTSSGLTKKEWKLMKEMLEYRITHFGDLHLFIKDIHNENDEENFTLETIDMEEFLKSGPHDINDEDFDADIDDYDFEDDDYSEDLEIVQEGIINRDVVIVTPTDEYLKLTGLEKRESTYLIPEFYDFEEEYKLWIRRNFKSIFELEIIDIAGDKRPKKLTFALFDKYFTIKRLTLAYDLLSEPIYKQG